MVRTLTGQAIDVGEFGAMKGNSGALALALALVWTFAAFGEELAYCGYVLNRLADLLDHSRGRSSSTGSSTR